MHSLSRGETLHFFVPLPFPILSTPHFHTCSEKKANFSLLQWNSFSLSIPRGEICHASSLLSFSPLAPQLCLNSSDLLRRPPLPQLPLKSPHPFSSWEIGRKLLLPIASLVPTIDSVFSLSSYPTFSRNFRHSETFFFRVYRTICFLFCAAGGGRLSALFSLQRRGN